MKEQIESNIDSRYEQLIRGWEQLSEEEKLAEAYRLIQQEKEIDVDTAYLSVKSRLREKRLVIRLYRQINRYAAILLLPLLLIATWSLIDKFSQADTANYSQSVQEVYCPIGTRSQVQLPDGTEIWLNAGTTIKYNLPFSSANRTIELNGEAFLDVAKLDNSEFKIYSNNVEVVVLGTQFNFRAYDLDDRVEVSLVEGRIDLNITDDNQNVRQAKLKQGDHLSYNKVENTTELVNQNLNNFIAWREGLLVFDDASLLEVAKELERWYGVDVEIADESLLSYRYTTTFENESIQQVLDLLELSSSLIIDYFPKTEMDSGRSKVIMRKRQMNMTDKN